MPKKKKGGSAKKSKLSDEEKALLAEQQLLAQGEEREKRRVVAVKFLQEKLQHEEQNAKISLMKINSQWRSILRQAKQDELKMELDILSQVFERVLDRKESVIQSYLRDLAEAEQQDQIAARGHIANVDRLVEFQQEVTSRMREAFQQELDQIREEFMKEREMILEHHEKEMADIKVIIYALEMLYEDRSKRDDSEFTSRRDEMRSKNLDARTTLKASLETTHKEVWDVFDQAMQQYQNSTAEKRAEYTRLKNRDRNAGEQIESNMSRLQKLQDKIAAYRQRIATNAKGTHGSNIELKRDKESVAKQVHQLKAHIQRTRAREERTLVDVVMKGKECQQRLEKKLESAKQVLTLAEVCSKYETEEEKVLPFYKSTVTEEEAVEEQIKQNEMGQEVGSLDEPLTDEEKAALAPKEELPGPTDTHALAYDLSNRQVKTQECMDNFWKRHNKVLLEQLAVEREVQVLEAENEELKSVLKQYLDGISVSEEVLSNNNTLLVVNSRTNAPLNVPVGDQRVQVARPAVIEASHVMQQTGVRHG